MITSKEGLCGEWRRGENSRARAPSERVLTVCEGEEKGPYRPGAVGMGKQPMWHTFGGGERGRVRLRLRLAHVQALWVPPR